MANDEDHSAFARQLLLGRLPEAVVLTEVSIAGDRPRMTPASLLKGAWIQAPKELDVEIADGSTTRHQLELGVENGNLDGSRFEEKTIAQVSQIENSAARVICVLKNGHTDRASNPWELFCWKIDVNVPLSSKIFSEYLGLDHMLAIVCKSNESIKHLEPYDRKGKSARAVGFMGLLAAGGSTKKLALPKPRLPNGTCPSGFIDFAVNMINVENANSSCRTASGLGLRETSFYSLFSCLQVYKTRTEMMLALPCISDGALSLDGGMIKRTGLFSLGSR
ncbi:hypothetical protein Syun_019763 [Stephania yunnanensis]|uniref:Uncharacterized protein n=1 Tax=Stephania yunnanensis TaxID=152371 RepID=A0AAP0IX37_9MAGN